MHLTPSTVIATLALVFAMSGGAYAAKHYLITSTKQISPKVLKALKGANGTNGAAGSPGATGPAGLGGAAGPQGAKGETGVAGPVGPQGPGGAAGAKGETGAAGAPGANGTNGTNGTTGFTETLPSGKTETGGWALSPSAEGIALAPISFNIPLAHALEAANVHFVEANGNGSTCPGTVQTPTATPGNLCVYKDFVLDLTFEAIIQYNGATSGADTAGALLKFEAGAEAPRIAFGTWAVTAE
jgi:hypothetical protein